jgi:diguanylate cyclase (GGDEF)-like protein
MQPEFQPTAVEADAVAASPAQPLPQAWISYTVRRLEPWVAWSIAVYTAWLALFAYPGLPGVWLLCLYAGLVGKWAEVHPARHQAEMALRGVALVLGALVLHTYAAPEAGGPQGPFFFWLSITCLYYAFMLKPAWSAGVVACALVEFIATTLLAHPQVSLADLAATAGFLAVFPLLLAVRFGAIMRQPDQALEEGRVDRVTGLYNQEGLEAHGNELLASCRRDHRPVSMAVFDCSDLLEVRSIYGSRTSRKLIARVVRKIAAAAGERGLAARTGPTQFTLVLPGMGRDKALAAIHKVMGSPSRIEFDAGDSEIVLVPELAVDAIRDEHRTVQEVLHELCRSLRDGREREDRRQRYLRRERERHSRPMGLETPALRRPPARLAPIAPTLPVPLAAP